MRRWSIRILIALLVLLLIVIGVTQVVLSYTTIPDRIVLAQVQRELGLRMTASSVDAGWFGNTLIRDVTLSLPLASESLLAAPELRVRHTWLPLLLLTQKLEIERLTLDDAKLLVRQDAGGRWNLQDLAELLARTGGKQQAATTGTRRSGPKLPGVVVHDGTLTITDKAGRSATLMPLEFSGLPDGPLVWTYEAKVGTTLSAVGKLSPGFEWAHEVAFEVTDGGDLLQPWLGKLEHPLGATGHWEGKLKSGQVIGRLAIDQAQALGTTASGVVRARAGGGAARIEPQQVILRTDRKLLPQVQVGSGVIDVTATTVRATRVQVAALDGVAQVDGQWDLARSAGELSASWDEIAQPGGVRHGGSLTAAVTSPLGKPSVTATLLSHGSVPTGQWRAQLKLTGGGDGWRDMDWVVTAPALSWAGPPRDVMLDGLVLRLATTPSALTLNRIELPGAQQVAGDGSINFDTNQWSLKLSGRNWPLPQLNQSTLEFRLAAGGDFKLLKLDELYLKTGEVQLAADGFYDLKIPRPLDLDVKLTHVPQGGGAGDPTLRGTLRAEAHVTGVAWPLDVDLSGKVLGEALRVKERTIGDVAIDVDGHVSPEQATLTSREIDLLGGRWSIAADWHKEKDLARMTVKTRDLPLSQAAEAIGEVPVSGTLNGAWTFSLPGLDRSRLSAAGEFVARDVIVRDLPVARAAGPMKMSDGRIEIGPVELTQAKGRATANVSLALAAPKKPSITLNATDWPVDLLAAGAAVNVSAETKLALDLAAMSATGPLRAKADIALEEQHLGQARLTAELIGRAARLTSIEADAFSGSAIGTAQIDLDKLLATTGELTWRDMDAADIAKLFPQLDGLAGRFGGSAKLGPAIDPRALEPLRLDVVLDSYGGSYRGAVVGDGSLTAFMNYETRQDQPGVGDRFRIVLADTQDDPSLIRFADGIVRIWGRFGRHRGVREPAGQITLDLDRLSLDQLVRIGQPETDPKPGRVSGTINVYGAVGELSRLSGLGSIRLTDSDLANLDVFAFLYDQMNVLNWGEDKPQLQGEGSLDLRFEAESLYLNNVRYMNRGTEIRAGGVVRKVWEGAESPVEATAVGSVRPFSSLDLPLLADVDDVLSVLQSNVTSAEVVGTVGDYEVKLVPFGEIGAGLRSFLLGDVQAETRNR